MAECLNRHYVRTKFRQNPRGSGIFCVDLTWNDPYTSQQLELASQRKREDKPKPQLNSNSYWFCTSSVELGWPRPRVQLYHLVFSYIDSHSLHKHWSASLGAVVKTISHRSRNHPLHGCHHWQAQRHCPLILRRSFYLWFCGPSVLTLSACNV